MIPKLRFVTLLVLGGLLPLAGMAADPGNGTPAGTIPGADRPPASTQAPPTQPYEPGPPPGPASATTTDGSPGPGGTLPPGTSPRDDGMAPMFKELDTNKDGYISRDEARRSADTSARFNEMDADRDGRISAAEWKAAEDRKNGH